MLKFLYLLLASTTLVLAAESRHTVLVLGDSIAAGYGLDQEEAFPARLQEKIDHAKLPYKVVNAGVSGDTTAGGLRRLPWLLKQPVDILLVELGGNDGLRGVQPQETEKNLQQIIDTLRQKYPSAKVVIAGMQMPPNMGLEYTRQFRDLFAKVAKKNQAVLIPFLLEGVGARAELNQADRIHPTAEGHKIVANTVWAALEPLLRERAKDLAERTPAQAARVQ